MTELDRSYSLCHRFARDSASNFYYSFYLLPRAKRRAMHALYAFMRRVDNIGDAAAARNQGISDSCDLRFAQLDQLRVSLGRALSGEYEDALWPAIADTIRRFSIPQHYLEDVIAGVEMDVRGERFETFEDLSRYCHCVAGVVGQACLHIWGFHDPRALVLAEDCGQAFQLTNILRDLAEDAERGRIYLPAEDLRRFEYPREDLLRRVPDNKFEPLLQFQIERAEGFYARAAELPRYLHRDGLRIFRAMVGTYRQLLEEVKRLGGLVLERRVSLTRGQKLKIFINALVAWPTRPTPDVIADTAADNSSQAAASSG